jgi:hypothetical protein
MFRKIHHAGVRQDSAFPFAQSRREKAVALKNALSYAAPLVSNQTHP